MSDDFVNVYSKATGRKRSIPPHWLDNERLMAPFEKTPLQKLADEAAALKGKALETALTAAGLENTGKADEKRERLAAFRAEQAALEVIAANDDLHDDEDDDPVVEPLEDVPGGDVTPDPLAPTTDTPHGGEPEGA